MQICSMKRISTLKKCVCGVFVPSRQGGTREVHVGSKISTALGPIEQSIGVHV